MPNTSRIDAAGALHYIIARRKLVDQPEALLAGDLLSPSHRIRDSRPAHPEGLRKGRGGVEVRRTSNPE
jgi:hypothetical protein